MIEDDIFIFYLFILGKKGGGGGVSVEHVDEAFEDMGLEVHLDV